MDCCVFCEEENRNKGATLKVKLPMDENGYPVLPSWEAIDLGGLMYKKMVIGEFMSKTMYGIAASGGKGRVPWAKLREAQGDFIAAKYLPEGVTLTQYHHLCLKDANALLKHWIQRQAAGKVPFCFKKVQKADRHHGGERGSGNYHSSAGAGPSGQSQGDASRSPSSSANGQQPHEELPMQEDGGILPPHPPNPPPPPPRTCPAPRIITQCRPPTGSPRAGPPHENPPINQSGLNKIRVAAPLQGPKHITRRRRSKGHVLL
ncbi:hypothetical protein EDB83DRAFT_2319893 [Lactarius deliciosus]|nr:hypothetical protein EDB83DRAFT_2319893 [Lactarius deliciosus]